MFLALKLILIKKQKFGKWNCIEHIRKFPNIWKSIRAKIEENTGGIVQYDKDYMKIKFERNDNLPTDSVINMHQVTIIIRTAFAQNDRFYPQLFLYGALYEL